MAGEPIKTNEWKAPPVIREDPAFLKTDAVRAEVMHPWRPI